MFETECTLNSFALGYLRNIVADLDDLDLATLGDSTGKTPQWILGHLRIAAEFGIQMLGHSPACGDDWFKAYGPGSQPGSSGAPEFTIAGVMSDIESGYARLLELTKSATEEQLAERHGFEPLEPVIMSKRDLMSHLLTTHLMYHLAQLSACRRSKGLGPIF